MTHREKKKKKSMKFDLYAKNFKKLKISPFKPLLPFLDARYKKKILSVFTQYFKILKINRLTKNQHFSSIFTLLPFHLFALSPFYPFTLSPFHPFAAHR
jgi:hypothetical protein